jgi:hypothetical protein
LVIQNKALAVGKWDGLLAVISLRTLSIKHRNSYFVCRLRRAAFFKFPYIFAFQLITTAVGEGSKSIKVLQIRAVAIFKAI